MGSVLRMLKGFDVLGPSSAIRQVTMKRIFVGQEAGVAANFHHIVMTIPVFDKIR
jgi:hypothetical protein